jgi:tryptophan-rich sensory protein
MKRRLKTLIGISFFVILCLSIGGLSGFITQAAIPTWYADLEKPFFTPPNWLFAPVWTILYCLMGIAAGLVWSKGSHHRWVKTALYHFGAQLIVNGLWSIVFFGLKSPRIALLVIGLLLYLVIKTIYWFKIVNRPSAYLLYPYLLWVSFASFLNLGIYYLNN